jgi:hypothetical protein
MKLFIMQFSPTSCHFISLRSKYSPQNLVLKHPQFYVPLLMSEAKFRTHTEQQAELFLYILIFMFLDRRREDKSLRTEWYYSALHSPIGNELRRILWNPKVHYHVHKSALLDPVWARQIHCVGFYTLGFIFIIHFQITLFSHLPLDLLIDFFTSILKSKFYMHLSSLCACCISCSSPRFYLIKFME